MEMNNGGAKWTTQARAPAQLNKTSNLCLETPEGFAAAQNTLSLTGEFLGETHRVRERIQNHSPENQLHMGLF